jgi:phosphomannomutase
MTDSLLQDWLKTARLWANNDCDPADQAIIRAQIAAAEASPDPSGPAAAALKKHFGAMLEFGTAGLRAEVGPGIGCINRSLVRVATHAVALDLLRHAPTAKDRPVVLGYDARLTSRAFAEEAAGVLVAAGLRVRYCESALPTPMVAYALRKYEGCAGIVITASHNPKNDNGYKLYDATGIQIVSPTDQRVAQLMTENSNAVAIAFTPGVLEGASPLGEPVEARIFEEYFADIDGLRPKHGLKRDLRIVYTPIHGVGYAPVRRALTTAGFTSLQVVAEQAEPDGHFPTAPNPNPEREGVMDLALALAKASNAELVLANDPDADRLAVCAPDAPGVYRKLSGNQVGILLADYVLSKYQGDKPPLVACSIVSTPMLDAVAKKYGAHSEKTLTGFKWVWNAALELSRTQGYRYVFGFEEALGYCVGELVRDKDGVSAALIFAEMAAELSAQGSSVVKRLEELYREHGLWVSTQLSIKKEPPEGTVLIQRAVQTLADAPPKTIGRLKVTQMIDYRSGGELRPRWLENNPLLDFSLEGGGRILVRPSGTEPLLKIYVDMPHAVPAGADIWQSEQAYVKSALELAGEVRNLTGL